MNSPPIWYIHGAFASPRSFAWLKGELPEHEAINVEYSCSGQLSRVIDKIVEQARTEEQIDIIGHSLGGVIGVILAHRLPNIRRVVTMSSPFGGSRIAAFLQFITPGTFMQDVQPLSPIMSEVRSKELSVPVLSLVTTGGRSPAILEPNDGVVSLQSQRALNGPRFIERPVNHFEVLLDEETPRIISEFLWTR
jgi:pimeloyl-ACP methyl ester carboxylesterase